ncbi:hypothetical protein GmHk_11G030650 [Glycine max]|nr:hypothetical protein GYH30_029573 [Glycine max]KAH1223059.1 hypothetical protein GmHk_11G030650 [Glycine max]
MRTKRGDKGKRSKGEEEAVFGDSEDDSEVVGGEQSEHGGNGLLHGFSGGGGHTFRDGRVVKGLDAAEDGGDHGEATVEVARGDNVIGEAGGDEAAAAAHEGEEDGGWRRRRERGRLRSSGAKNSSKTCAAPPCAAAIAAAPAAT